MPLSDTDINEKFEKIEKKLGIPKERLREVYDEILARSKKLRPSVPIETKRLVSYALIKHAILWGYPVSFCPHCPEYTTDIHNLQSHLKKMHNWGKADLDRVRKGFWAAKDKKRLDYHPKPP